MKHSKFAFSLIFFLATFSFNHAHAQTTKELVVLVKYKTQPGKDSVALTALRNLIAQVKNEPNYIDIKIHVDPSDKSNILLYEKWGDEGYFKGEHMSTPHLRQFMTEARAFLGGPPEITFWKIDN